MTGDQTRAALHRRLDWKSYEERSAALLALRQRRVAEAVARATADAIADKIEAERDGDGDKWAQYQHAPGMTRAARIARSHGSQARTTEDGQ
jgi:hypothetical protein